MTRSLDPLAQEAARIRENLDRFEEHGDLARLPARDLRTLTRRCRTNLDDAYRLCKAHEQRFPSTTWFFISTGSGFGALFLLEPTVASVVFTTGGCLAAGKSLYDRGKHLFVEQRYLGLYWRAVGHKNAIAAEMSRRGLRY